MVVDDNPMLTRELITARQPSGLRPTNGGVVGNMAGSDIDMEDLARRMCELDEKAYQKFANHFGPRLRSFFRRGLSVVDAEDLAVSCVTDIALRVGNYRAVSRVGFETWIFTLARHFLLDWWRTHRSSESPYEDLPSELPAEIELEHDPELISAVLGALAQLSEDGRTVIQAIEFRARQGTIGSLASVTPQLA